MAGGRSASQPARPDARDRGDGGRRALGARADEAAATGREPGAAAAGGTGRTAGSAAAGAAGRARGAAAADAGRADAPQQQEQQAAEQAAEKAAADKAAAHKAEAAKAAEEKAAAQRAAQAAAADRSAALADLQRSLAAEEHADSVRSSGALASWQAQITAKIKRAWLRPPTAKAGIECMLNVTQVPGGEVTEVSIGDCNGDQAVRESIEAAVYRASPLPPPPDPSLFDRNLIIRFKPD